MSREIVAGITTFLTMSYIVVVNPAILSTPGTGIPFSGALTATVLVCFTMTLLMGVYARLPFGVAPGMGLNAFFTYTLIINGGVPWPVALGIIFWAGVVFLLVSVDAAARAHRDGHSRHRCVRRRRRASGCCSRSSDCRTRASSPPTRPRWSASGRSIIARCSRSWD